MNTSIQDAFNLGWKLRLVLEGRLSPTALSTYETERRPVAQDLIAFDRGYLKLFSAPSASFDDEFIRAMKFTTGLSIRYQVSALVQLPGGATEHTLPSLLKADVVPGKRLPDFQVVCQVDGVTTYIHPRMQASGAFRLLVFPGDIGRSCPFEKLQKLGSWLGDHDEGLGRITSTGSYGAHAIVEVLVVHCAERDQVELLSLHDVFHPWDETFGWDYSRVYADVESAHEGHGKVYEKLGLDRENGCSIIVRPDGYIGAVVPIDDQAGLQRYFSNLV
jgi:phenol 2-monooxygenase